MITRGEFTDDFPSRLDEVVDVLTQLVQQGSVQHLVHGAEMGETDTIEPFDLAEFAGEVLTRVAANVGSLDALVAGACDGEKADAVRALVGATTGPEPLRTWRTAPIQVGPIFVDDELAAELGPFDAALLRLEERHSDAWAEAAAASTNPDVQAFLARPAGEFDNILGDVDPSPERLAAFQDYQEAYRAIDPLVSSDSTVAGFARVLAAAEAERNGALASYEASFLDAMNVAARERGYGVPVVVAEDYSDVDRDEDLVTELEEAARAATARPTLTPPNL